MEPQGWSLRFSFWNMVLRHWMVAARRFDKRSGLVFKGWNVHEEIIHDG